MNNERIATELLKVAESLTAKTGRYEKIKEIIDERQMMKIDGVAIDMVTADMLMNVYDAVKPEMKKRLDKLPIKALVGLGWKLVS